MGLLDGDVFSAFIVKILMVPWVEIKIRVMKCNHTKFQPPVTRGKSPEFCDNNGYFLSTNPKFGGLKTDFWLCVHKTKNHFFYCSELLGLVDLRFLRIFEIWRTLVSTYWSCMAGGLIDQGPGQNSKVVYTNRNTMYAYTW